MCNNIFFVVLINAALWVLIGAILLNFGIIGLLFLIPYIFFASYKTYKWWYEIRKLPPYNSNPKTIFVEFVEGFFSYLLILLCTGIWGLSILGIYFVIKKYL